MYKYEQAAAVTSVCSHAYLRWITLVLLYLAKNVRVRRYYRYAATRYVREYSEKKEIAPQNVDTSSTAVGSDAVRPA